MKERTVDDVRSFWEAHPLFAGESDHPPGSREFFEQHRRVVIEDCFAGRLDPRVFPAGAEMDRVLDLGCGPGFWTVCLAQHGAREIVAADLTRSAIALTRKRAETYDVEIETCRQNAECMSLGDGEFSHVNCQGVIHHTPDTEACVREIARVLRPGGTALISVYYRNLLLRSWPVLKHLGRVLSFLGAGMKGRGREQIYATGDVEEVVRLYDGAENPVGKAYSRKELLDMVTPSFEVNDVFCHFFPARSFPFRLPAWLHRFLDRRLGFMIYVKGRKRLDVRGA